MIDNYLKVALALKAMTTTYKMVKKYESKVKKKRRSKHTAVTNKNGRLNN